MSHRTSVSRSRGALGLRLLADLAPRGERAREHRPACLTKSVKPAVLVVAVLAHQVRAHDVVAVGRVIETEHVADLVGERLAKRDRPILGVMVGGEYEADTVGNDGLEARARPAPESRLAEVPRRATDDDEQEVTGR